MEIKLIDGQRIGTQVSIAHINNGQSPHEWKEIEVPIYARHPDAIRLKNVRLSLGLSISEAARILNLSISDYSALEHGRKVLSGIDMYDVIKELGGN